MYRQFVLTPPPPYNNTAISCVYVYTCVYTSTYVYTCVYMCVCVCAYACVVFANTRMHACVCVYIFMLMIVHKWHAFRLSIGPYK